MQSLGGFDRVIKMIENIGFIPTVTCNKGHIAVRTNRRNFGWFHPRKKETYCHFDIRIGEDNVDKIKEILGASEMAFTKKKRADAFAIQLRLDNIGKPGTLKKALKLAWAA